jgi:peptidoglycan hydrolase-like protein with peptidoglycan-binding domain
MGFINRKLPILAAGLLLAASMALATTPPKKHSSKSKTHTTGKLHRTSHRSGKKTRKPRGQQAIDQDRARDIQEALVREHYLTGEPSGKWDAATQQAMRKYQADQGWQTKVVPDSRALIRLGLGPNHDHLLNPESAMVSGAVPAAHVAPSGSANSSPALPARNSAASPVTAPSDLASSR